VNLARDQKEEASCGPSTQVIFRVHFASMKLGPQRANLMGVKMSERTHTAPTAAQELTRLPSAVSISLARLRIFWSHAEASTRFQPIFVRKARPTAPVSMPYSTVRRKNRIYMWPLQVDLYSVEHDDVGQAAFNPTTARTFRYRFWNGLPENPT